MVGLATLWLPILVSAVIVFIASSIVHQVLPIHRNDYAQLPGEDKVLGAMRDAGVQPGQYFFPFMTPKDMATPENQERLAKGPVGFAHIQANGPPAIGRSLIQWFVHLLVIGLFIAYLCGRVLGPGADYLRVFQIAGTAALLAHCGDVPVRSIWMGNTWSSSAKHFLDGVLFALLTAGVFGWLWP